MQNIHLICSAHLDPVWLWQWEEGASAAVSTFRTAMDFIDQYDGFVFNHNEALLYEWVEEYEPALFERIRQAVAAGKWHIMGGWYLQPDCNMPCGESFVRQILVGKRYFKEKFGVTPLVAANFDSFGHTRGLVQILKKSGYDAYLFMRPDPTPYGSFQWVGFDGSKVIGHRIYKGYHSLKGMALEKLQAYMQEHAAQETGMLTWGIGDHGGGASRPDLEAIEAFRRANPALHVMHSNPEAYFAEVDGEQLPEKACSLRPFHVGCYTTMSRIKQLHRRLENELYVTERMMVHADIWDPDIRAAEKTLLFNEFHDVLPGSMIKPSEEDSIRSMHYALEILSKLKAKCFFKLCEGQPSVRDGEIPVLVYNPHPYTVKQVISCEFQLEDQNWTDGEYTIAHVFQGEKELPAQNEKEYSNIPLDWRKHLVFEAELAPCSINRFDCRLEVVTDFGPQPHEETETHVVFQSDMAEVRINKATGLLDVYRIKGKNYLAERAMQLLVVEDREDAWGMSVDGFTHVIGEFALLSPEKANALAGYPEETTPAVRVVENGPVRMVVEAVFGYGDSYAVVWYLINKSDGGLEVSIRLLWNEVNKMAKLSIPTAVDGTFLGQTAFGTEQLRMNGLEETFQKWCGLLSGKAGVGVLNNGIYAGSCEGNEMRITLLRSAGYSAHPLEGRQVMPKNRVLPHVDMGEREFHIKLVAGETVLDRLDCLAEQYNKVPYALSFFPSGQGEKRPPLIELDNRLVILSACKRAADGNGYILRLYNASASAQSTEVRLPMFDLCETVHLGGYEVASFRLDGGFSRVNLLEEEEH